MTGRQVKALGQKWVLNLANKGQIRKAPGTNKTATCVRGKLLDKKFEASLIGKPKQRLAAAATACGTTKGAYLEKKKKKTTKK